MSRSVLALPDLPVLAWFSNRLPSRIVGQREKASATMVIEGANRVITLYRQMPTRTGADFHL
jgi:hypothetical protein